MRAHALLIGCCSPSLTPSASGFEAALSPSDREFPGWGCAEVRIRASEACTGGYPSQSPPYHRSGPGGRVGRGARGVLSPPAFPRGNSGSPLGPGLEETPCGCGPLTLHRRRGGARNSNSSGRLEEFLPAAVHPSRPGHAPDGAALQEIEFGFQGRPRGPPDAARPWRA